MSQGLPADIQPIVRNFFNESIGTRVDLGKFTAIAGGCINHGGKLETSVGAYFIKWNDAIRFPGMFDAERRGLERICATSAIHVPRVIFSGCSEVHQFLLMTFTSSSARMPGYWLRLGESLAKVHRHRSALFGLDHSNYIGSLPQINGQDDSWVNFLVLNRLEKQLEIADGKVDSSTRKNFEKLYRRLPDLISLEAPSLLHGDLWNGNIMTNESGEPSLIDPAVYFGHREVDLAMSQLFGGFHPDFLDSYNNSFPLVPGFRDRFDIYNLYPLLVHVNLFGGGYLTQVKEILRKFV